MGYSSRVSLEPLSVKETLRFLGAVCEASLAAALAATAETAAVAVVAERIVEPRLYLTRTNDGLNFDRGELTNGGAMGDEEGRHVTNQRKAHVQMTQGIEDGGVSKRSLFYLNKNN